VAAGESDKLRRNIRIRQAGKTEAAAGNGRSAGGKLKLQAKVVAGSSHSLIVHFLWRIQYHAAFLKRDLPTADDPCNSTTGRMIHRLQATMVVHGAIVSFGHRVPHAGNQCQGRKLHLIL
jgi:hypothetical protein